MIDLKTLAGQPQSSIASKDRPTILALHCTASSGRQWRALAEAAGDRAQVISPDIEDLPVHGATDDLDTVAEAVLDLIDRVDAPVHLVGHSYGAGLALRTALKRPERIAGLYLYEPTAFGLLRHLGPEGQRAGREITALAGAIEALVGIGKHEEAMRAFVDYWQGEGSWLAIPPEIRARFVTRVPRVPKDFSALHADPMTSGDLRSLWVPGLILSGEATALPTRLLADAIAGWLPASTSRVISGAGHMGPVTHAGRVARILCQAILDRHASILGQGVTSAVTGSGLYARSADADGRSFAPPK